GTSEKGEERIKTLEWSVLQGASDACGAIRGGNGGGCGGGGGVAMERQIEKEWSAG
ncbi:unnamed protein product, partial [Ilex paraguariensis]